MTDQSIELRAASGLEALEPVPDARPARSQAAALAMTVRLAGQIAAVITIACAVVALAVHVWFASDARRWLAFPFPGLPPRPAIAARILLHNLRALTAIGGLLLIAQSRSWARVGKEPGRGHRVIRRAGEVLLAAAIIANLIVVGASFGAYGARMLQAALPHGPVELAAYSVALALYVAGRERRLPARPVVTVMAMSVGLLALAAFLETYVNL